MAAELPTSASVTGAGTTNAQQKVNLAAIVNFLIGYFGTKFGIGPQTVASATSVDLEAVVETRDLVISGTTAITGFVVEAGKVFRCRASGAFVLTNNSAIVTNTGANIAVAANDSFVLRATATDTVEILQFVRAAAKISLDRNVAVYTANADLTAVMPTGSVPQNTEGTQVLSTTVTTRSATDKVRIWFDGTLAATTATQLVAAAVFHNSVAAAIRSKYVFTVAISLPVDIGFYHEFVPGTVGVQTIAVRVGAQTNTARMNGSTAAAYGGGSQAATLVAEVVTA